MTSSATKMTPDAMSMTPDTTKTPQSGGMAGMPMGATSTVYFMIVNDGGTDDTLTGVSADFATVSEMHQTTIENNIAQMSQVSKVVVPAHGTLEFKPDGYHVMLSGLSKDLVLGQTVRLTFHFEKSGSITVDATVGTGQ